MNLIKTIQCLFWGHRDFKVYRGGRDTRTVLATGPVGLSCGRCGRWKHLNQGDKLETYAKKKE